MTNQLKESQQEKAEKNGKKLNRKKVKEAILFTVKFFNLLDYPLTIKQIHKYLFNQEAKLRQVEAGVKSLKERGKLNRQGDFWFLPGREKLAKLRKKKERISQRYRRKLKLLGWVFKITPFVRSVAVCNNLAFNNVDGESDIDVFILTRKDKLWISRLISTTLVNLLGQRNIAESKEEPGKLCLSFYLAEDNLKLKDIALDKDPYLLYWLATLEPIYDHGLFSKFLKENSWGLKFFPNLKIKSKQTPKKALSLPAFLLEKLFNLLPQGLLKAIYEKQKKAFKDKIEKEPPEKGVVLKKSIFKTHLSDKRGWFRKKLKDGLGKALNQEHKNA